MSNRNDNRAFLVLLLLSFCVIKTPSYAEPKSAPEKAGKSQETIEQPFIIKTNMFDLEYERLQQFNRKKFGGGIGYTDTELLLITGDGTVSIIELDTDKASTSSIVVPDNNEAEAMIEAERILPEEKIATAKKKIKANLRYDDIMILSNQKGRQIIVSYSHFDTTNRCFSTKLSLLRISSDRPLRTIQSAPEDWTNIFTSQPCFPLRGSRNNFAGHQSGGRMDILDAEKGDIVLALGDYEFDGLAGPDYPQDLNASYGKVWKINVYSLEREIISVGLRNPQGIKVDNNGKIWTVGHGPFGGDELNSPEKGRNFGWPKVLLGIQYGRGPWPQNVSQGRHDGFDYPVFSWVPSIAPSNMDQSQSFHPFWEGDLLVFTLKTKSIHRLRIQDGRVIFDEQLQFKERIRYGLNHEASGSIYIWADNGEFFRIKPTEDAFKLVDRSEAALKRFKTSKTNAEPTHSAALSECLECHSGLRGAPPSLENILGADIAASDDYTGYSEALLSKKGVWTAASLRRFLRNPQEFAPGTSMSNPAFTSEKEIDEVIGALSHLKN